MKPLFTETQRFNQWWVWLIIVFACGVPFIGFFRQVILGKPWGNNPMSDTALTFALIFSSLFILLFYAMRLKTEITRESISFGFAPFVKRSYSLAEIETYKVINYGFVGGWGIRFTMKYGTVYNIKGNKGLFVKLKNGTTFIIGTQKPDEMERVVQQLKH